jgi:hypothetical protein
MGLCTWFLFQNQCFTSFWKGWNSFDKQLNEIDCNETDDIFYGSTCFSWQAGAGLIALGDATLAKVLDLPCNLLIPTPSITQSKKEQWEYEHLATIDSTACCNGDMTTTTLVGIVLVEKGLQDCPGSLIRKRRH